MSDNSDLENAIFNHLSEAEYDFKDLQIREGEFRLKLSKPGAEPKGFMVELMKKFGGEDAVKSMRGRRMGRARCEFVLEDAGMRVTRSSMWDPRYLLVIPGICFFLFWVWGVLTAIKAGSEGVDLWSNPFTYIGLGFIIVVLTFATLMAVREAKKYRAFASVLDPDTFIPF